ncbi:MAG TPA: ABC transporter permease [Halomicronema sp.]
MASIARKNLFEDIPRFLIAQAGILFAVSLVTIQTGILQGFMRSTAVLIDNSKADLWVASKYMVNLELTLPMPYERVGVAKKVEGVEKAEALMLRTSLWRDPKENISLVRIIGFDFEGELFKPEPLKRGDFKFLQQPYSVIIDESMMKSLNVGWLGDQVMIGSLNANLVGWTQGTQSIVSSAYVYSSLESAVSFLYSDPFAMSGDTQINLLPEDLQEISSGKISPQLWGKLAKMPKERLKDLVNTSPLPPELSEQLRGLSGEEIKKMALRQSKEMPIKKEPITSRKLSDKDPISYILIKATPGTDIYELKYNLEKAFPDSRALTRSEMAEKTRAYWLQRTGIGFILGLGAMVGVIVGAVIVGQILYASACDHIKEFGTLKAMGASDWVIYGIILEQALWMGVLGYIPGMLLCWGLGKWTLATQGIVILITPLSASAVFGVTILMCVGSALFAIQKVISVDPAIVFKA